MEYANALRELIKDPIWPLVAQCLAVAYEKAIKREALVHRVVARLGDLAEAAYLIGHDEGYKNGLEEGIMEGRDEANCHRQTDEEWVHDHA